MSRLDNVDLTPPEMRTLRGLLRHYVPEATVWAFGSRATFKARPHSDLDLVLFGDDSQVAGIPDLHEALEESDLPFTVDILIWDAIPEHFKPNIKKAYFVVQQAPEKEMSKGWRKIHLGQIADICTGKTNRQDASQDGNYPLFDRSSSIKRSDKYLFDCQAVIVPGEGRHFIPRYYSGKFDLHQRVYKISSKEEYVASTRYLYYFLSLNKRYWEQIAVGSTVKSLRLISFTEFPVLLPPPAYQKAIAHILGTLDDKIELNQKMNQTLEEIAKAIFKSWFVNFDPVRAKAEGRPTGLPPEISDLFPDELVNSEIGEIPKGWELQPLSKQIKVNPKYVLKKGTDAYFVEMKCLSESTSSVSEGYVRSFTSGSKFQRFDTLFARITPCLENSKTGLLLNKSASDVCWGSTEFIVLSPQDDQSPLFPYCWARSDNLRTAAVSSMTGSSGRQRVPNDFFDSYLVANPDSTLHQTFQKIADPIIDRIQVCNEEMTTLSQLRDTLLPKLISGELRVPDAEKFIEEAGI